MKSLSTVRRLNGSGIAHHFLFPVLAVIAVAVIGVYTLTLSHAQTAAPQAGPSAVTTCTTKSSLTVVWAAVGGATKYEALVLGPSSGVKADPNALTVTHAVFSIATSGTSGSVKVRAGNTHGWGPWSASKTFSFAKVSVSCSTSAASSSSSGSTSSGGGSNQGASEGKAFLARAVRWQGLGYANAGGYSGNGGLMHTSGYATFVKDCEGGSIGGTPKITTGTDSECATDCSGFVSVVVNDVLHTNYVWIAGYGALTGTGSSNWKAVSIGSAQPGDIAVGNGHVEFVKSGTGQNMTTYGEHASGQTVGNGGGYGIVQVYRWE